MGPPCPYVIKLHIQWFISFPVTDSLVHICDNGVEGLRLHRYLGAFDFYDPRTQQQAPCSSVEQRLKANKLL